MGAKSVIYEINLAPEIFTYFAEEGSSVRVRFVSMSDNDSYRGMRLHGSLYHI